VAETRPDVKLRIPAESAYLSVLRTVTAGLAARLDFTLDDIEDLRIAVDEATAMVLPQTLPDSDLSCSFFLSKARLDVTVTAACDAPRPPSQEGFAWTVLSALTSSLDASVDGNTLTISLSRVSSEAE